MIVVVANLKGGVGKTTSSMFLAHALAETTRARCVVIDADPQGSATQWGKIAADAGRPLAVPVLAQPTARLAKMAHSAPHVVIDTPPAHSDALDAAISVADLVVIPTSPSSLDLSCIERTVGAARRLGKTAVVLLTRTRRTRSVATAEESLRALGVRVLNTHIPLREAVAMGFGERVRQLHGYDLVMAELLGALPMQPYSVEAVRQRAEMPAARRYAPLEPQPRVISLGDQRPPPSAADSFRSAFDDDDLVKRLQSSMARLAAQN